MEECKNDSQNMIFPDVEFGDVVHISGTINYDGFYLVTREPFATDKKRLYALNNGAIWSSNSLFWSLDPSQVRLANVCYKECE